MEKRSCEPRDVVASKAGNGPQLIASKKLQTVLQPLRTEFREQPQQRNRFFSRASGKDATLLTP